MGNEAVTRWKRIDPRQGEAGLRVAPFSEALADNPPAIGSVR